MSNYPSVSEIRQLIENIDDQKYRIAFMYQYLIGGRVSEIGGKYKPVGNDAFLNEFNIYNKNIQAVIFKIMTARNEGKLRLCAIPLDEEYEPWSKIVYNYFKNFGNDCPFIFVKKGKLEYNDGKIMVKAREIFGKYKQKMNEYHNEDGKIPKRGKKFTSDGIRKLRIKKLRDDYNFSDEELKIFMGLDRSTFIHPYGKEEISELLNATKKYFNKLIIPLSELKKKDTNLF